MKKKSIEINIKRSALDSVKAVRRVMPPPTSFIPDKRQAKLKNIARREALAY